MPETRLTIVDASACAICHTEPHRRPPRPGAAVLTADELMRMQQLQCGRYRPRASDQV
jgi:hypothetical protein